MAAVPARANLLGLSDKADCLSALTTTPNCCCPTPTGELWRKRQTTRRRRGRDDLWKKTKPEENAGSLRL